MSPFDKAVSRLNSGNVNSLWELAALLAVLEYFGSHSLDLFPEMHYERPRLFCEAILASKATFWHHREYSADDFIKLINWSGEGLLDPRIEQIQHGRERKEMLFDLTRAAARWANIQIRYQDLWNGDLGRCFALYDVVSSKGHFRDEQTADLVKRVRARIDAFLGCSLTELLAVYAKVGLWQRQLYENLVHRLDLNPKCRPTLKRERLQRLRAVLCGLFECRQLLHPLISFTRSDVLELGSNVVRPEAFTAFRQCFCADTRTLRSLRARPAYSAGRECWHVSPLERYPVVQMQGLPRQATRYVVPNYRFYLRSLPAALDYTLLASLDAEYNQFRGAIFEAYIGMMLREMYPNSICLPEREYARVRAKKMKGPDIAFVEAIGEPLLLFEVKARRLRADTRSEMDNSSIDHNLADVYAALRRLPGKATDLFEGVCEYSEITDVLKTSSRDQAIGLCILPNVPFAINELTYYTREPW